MKKLKHIIPGIIITALGLVLTFGVLFIFPPCPPHDDGSFMSCHYAGLAVFAMGIALSVDGIIALAAGGSRIGAGASLAAIPIAVMAAVTPGIIIPLCKMTNMHCHTVMRPAVIIISVLAVLAALFNVITVMKGKDKK